MRSPTRSGRSRDKRQVFVRAEPHLSPIDRRVPVVHPQRLQPAVGHGPTGRDRDHGRQDGERLGEREPELSVGGVHQRVGTGLNFGGPGIQVVCPGAARPSHLAAHLARAASDS